MRGSLFYTIGIGFASGIFARSFFEIDLVDVGFLLFLGFSAALLWHFRKETVYAPLFLAATALISFSLGVVRLDFEAAPTPHAASFVGVEDTYTGTIVREPDYRARMVHLYVQFERFEEMLLVTTDRYQTFHYGDQVTVTGTITEPEAFETDLGRTFNYPGYLRAQGVEFTIPFAEVAVTGEGGGNPFIRTLLTGKAAFMDMVESLITEPQAGLGEGLLLGVKRALGDDLEAIFRKTGIIHIVVLSGYNVMLVADAVMRSLSLFFLPRTRLILGITGISIFALLVGLSSTVVRASIMAVLILVARATGRTYAILRALMLAGTIMLIVNPYLLVFDPGFQLSFLATMGLIFLAPLIEEKFRLVPTKFKVREFLTATIATQIMVLPLLLYLIGEFSLVAVIVNVLVLPMVPVAMLLTFAAGALGFVIPLLGTLVGFLAHLSLVYIITTATFFAGVPFASLAVPQFPFIFVVVLYGALGYGLYLLDRKREEPKPEDEEAEELLGWTIETVEEDEAKVPERTPLPFR